MTIPGADFQDTMLDDEATAYVWAAPAPRQGVYKPFDTLSFFDGKQAQGKWRLSVCAFNDTPPGTIESWSLSFNDTCAEEECPEVYMPDANLRTVVMDTLDLTDPAQLTTCTMKDLRGLLVMLLSIRNLTGLEHAANLRLSLFIYNSPIEDFSPLRYLPKLFGVFCEGARIDDLTSFVPSPLYWLGFQNTPIKRLDGVEGLVNLDLLLVHGGLLAASD